MVSSWRINKGVESDAGEFGLWFWFEYRLVHGGVRRFQSVSTSLRLAHGLLVDRVWALRFPTGLANPMVGLLVISHGAKGSESRT
jgi:hypothetical protein